MSAARCLNCDRPKAPPELYEHPGGCECAECIVHCWSDPDRPECEPHDWRTEALALRERVAQLQRLRDASYANVRVLVYALRGLATGILDNDVCWCSSPTPSRVHTLRCAAARAAVVMAQQS